MKDNSTYKWDYCSVGGVVRVKISKGEDIAHLGELDQKLWTVLSCPTKGLEFDKRTLDLLDTDGDGKIRVPEIVAAAEWLSAVIKDRDLLLKGDSSLPLSQINTENEEGAKLYGSAKQILSNLGLDKNEISIDDTSDSTRIFAGTGANGDGIITALSTEDPGLKKVIAAIIDRIGSAVDRSGEAGVDADMIQKFYDSCNAYSDWMAAAEKDKDAIFPFGDGTAAALAACEALKDKIADYFMRCKLIAFNAGTADALDLAVDKIGAITDQNLATCTDVISQCPLAKPTADGVLPFAGINPAWKGAFDTLKSLVLDVEFSGKDGITEDEWNATLAKFDAYKAWAGAKAGSEVEALGLDEVRAFIKANNRDGLLDLVAADKALEAEANGIDNVCKLMQYYRDFAKLLKNYVIFSDFYSRSPENMAVFEVGKLYVDQRCCELCIRVEDMVAHADMAAQSGMFLLYCTCTSKAKGQTMNIVAVMTAGGIKNLRPGKNGIFYDREGNDWDATVTKVVENPISVRQAFWSPYRKFANFISEKINKSAEDKDSAAIAGLQAKADGGAAKQPFDVTKFASTFALVGVAVAAVGAAFAGIIAAVKGLAWWKWLVIIAAIMLVISGPACFIAWRKLRKRNLGPVLNANGWAVNSAVLVNILFGSTLTSVAKYPKLKVDDPYAKKTPAWLKWLIGIVAAAAVAFCVLFFTNSLAGIGLPRHKEAPVEEVVADEAAEAADVETVVADAPVAEETAVE